MSTCCFQYNIFMTLFIYCVTFVKNSLFQLHLLAFLKRYCVPFGGFQAFNNRLFFLFLFFFLHRFTFWNHLSLRKTGWCLQNQKKWFVFLFLADCLVLCLCVFCFFVFFYVVFCCFYFFWGFFFSLSCAIQYFSNICTPYVLISNWLNHTISVYKLWPAKTLIMLSPASFLSYIYHHHLHIIIFIIIGILPLMYIVISVIIANISSL